MPSSQPSNTPTILPTTAPSAKPSNLNLAPTATPSIFTDSQLRFVLEVIIIQFEFGFSPTSGAVVAASVADMMRLSVEKVVFLSRRAINTARRLDSVFTTFGKISNLLNKEKESHEIGDQRFLQNVEFTSGVTVETTVPLIDFPEFDNNATAVFLELRRRVQEGIDSGAGNRFLRRRAVDANDLFTINANYTQFTVESLSLDDQASLNANVVESSIVFVMVGFIVLFTIFLFIFGVFYDEHVREKLKVHEFISNRSIWGMLGLVQTTP